MTSTPQTEALESWFKASSGHLHPNIRILEAPQDSEVASSGIHYRAVGPIDPGNTVVSASPSITLSYLNALVDDEFPVFQQQRHRFKVEAIGFWYLMVQYVNREQSFWKPYLDTLPSPDSDLEQPLFFEDPDDIAWLAGTDVWHTAVARKDVYRSYYEEGLQILEEAGFDVPPYTWRLFRWAVAIFTSRSFTSRSLNPSSSQHWDTYKSTNSGTRQSVTLDMSETPADDLIFPVLWPGIDGSNHNHDAKVLWIEDTDRFSISLDASAPAALNDGDEVFNNYGPKGNGELLLGYGFCVPDNPHDTIAMTLKRPIQSLQNELRQAGREYFTSEGEWSVEKTTFRFGQVQDQLADPWELFNSLPEPLLELLVYVLRNERGLSFIVEEHPRYYLTSTFSQGRKYAPHVARMIFHALSSKLAALTARQPMNDPRTSKQYYAAIYREAQIDIHAQYVHALRSFNRNLVWSQDLAKVSLRPNDVSLLDLDCFYALLRGGGYLQNDDFLTGVAANTNSRDLTTLWLAGWDEDLFVLLLCFTLLSLKLDQPDNQWLREALGDYVPLLTTPLQNSQQEPGHALELLAFVQQAATACGENNLWADQRWNAELLKTVGQQAMGRDSFELMQSIPVELREAAGGVQEMTKCYLCLYFGQ